jgi:hypothetical protein
LGFLQKKEHFIEYLVQVLWFERNRCQNACHERNKFTIFHTFILSNFNFCPLAWHFCTEKNSKKIEKVIGEAIYIRVSDRK